MKKSALLFITLLMVPLFMVPSVYATQTSPVDITTITDDGDIRSDTKARDNTSTVIQVQFTGAIYYRGYIEWDVSAIPDTATIYSVQMKITSQNDNSATDGSEIREITDQPSMTANADVYADAGDGDLYAIIPGLNVNASSTVNLGSDAVSDLQANLASDWFAVGLSRNTGVAVRYYWSEEAGLDVSPVLIVSCDNGNYTFVLDGLYYENGTYVSGGADVYVTAPSSSYMETVDGTLAVSDTELPTSLYWDIGGGYTRYIYTVDSENITVTYPEDTFYAYGFTVKDYTGKLGLGTAYLEAYRTINGTETLIERMKIVQPNAVPLNLVFGRTYHLKILFSDGTRYDWGYFLAGSDTTNTIIIRSTAFTEQAHMIYNIIMVDATRSADGTTITIDYNDTREVTVWANVTIQRRGGGIVLSSPQTNDTYTLNWASANADYGYIVSINGLHGDFGEWGYVWIFDESETFPDAPSLEGIWDWGLGDNLGGWLLVMAATLGFSKSLKARALIVGITVATLTNYIGFSSWTGDQLIFGWVFAVVVALAGGGAE